MRSPRSRTLCDPCTGFALLGLLAAVGVALALAGLVLPLSLSRIAAERVGRTRAGLDRLERAVRAFAEDTLTLPASTRDLLAPSCAPAGWGGPYLGDLFLAAPPGSPFRADADDFGSLVSWTLLDPTFGELRSAGPDGAWANGDDLVRAVDLRPALRSETMRRVAVLNGAIRRYLATEPSQNQWAPGAGWATALASLRARGYLDDDPAWDADAWGAAWVADAAGGGPGPPLLVRVTSTNL